MLLVSTVGFFVHRVRVGEEVNRTFSLKKDREAGKGTNPPH